MASYRPAFSEMPQPPPLAQSWQKPRKTFTRDCIFMQDEGRKCINIQPRLLFFGAHHSEKINNPGRFLGLSGLFWGFTRTAKVTTFYKIGDFSAFFAPVFGFSEDDFWSRRDGHFFARDGHYDSNDHREHFKGRFRGVRKLPFSAPLPSRQAYRQTPEGRKALWRCPNTENVYLYIFRKIFTIHSGEIIRHC